MFKVGDKVKHSIYQESYFGEIVEYVNEKFIKVRDFTFKSMGVDGIDIIKNTLYKEWYETEKNLIVIKSEEPKSEHIAGLSEEKVNWDKVMRDSWCGD